MSILAHCVRKIEQNWCRSCFSFDEMGKPLRTQDQRWNINYNKKNQLHPHNKTIIFLYISSVSSQNTCFTCVSTNAKPLLLCCNFHTDKKMLKPNQHYFVDTLYQMNICFGIWLEIIFTTNFVQTDYGDYERNQFKVYYSE